MDPEDFKKLRDRLDIIEGKTMVAVLLVALLVVIELYKALLQN